MRPVKFTLESLGCENFEGFTKDETWNGWACPYFTFEQARKVLKNYNQLRQITGQNDFAQYDLAVDAFVFPADDEEETETFDAVTANGQKYYPVGAYCWIWEELEQSK